MHKWVLFDPHRQRRSHTGTIYLVTVLPYQIHDLRAILLEKFENVLLVRDMGYLK